MAVPTATESGMTGNDLLDANQAFFTDAGVAVPFERAEDLAKKVLRDQKLQGNELKGKNLVKSARGRRAVRALIKEVGDEAISLRTTYKRRSNNRPQSAA